MSPNSPISHEASIPDEQWVEIEAILATNDVIKAYDGQFRLPEETLNSIATALNSGAIPFSGSHDSARRIRNRNVNAWVEKGEHGRLLVRFTADVVRSDWETHGNLPGMSLSVLEPLNGERLPEKSDTVLQFGADSAWFDDDAISTAAQSIRSSFNSPNQPLVSGNRFYQFSAIPDPRIVIETALMLWISLGPNLVASAIWDGLKVLLSRRKARSDMPPTTDTLIEVKVRTAEGGHVTALIRTNDTDVARDAVAKLPDITEILRRSDGKNSATHEWMDKRPQTGEPTWGWNELD